MNTFLPDNYQLPDNSNYMKFEKRPNKFRVLSAAIVGYVYWNTDGKPVRLKDAPQGTPSDIRIKDGKAESIKHFWAFVVWNYAKSKMQILEITQATIQGPMTDLVTSDDWGDPKEYDLVVSKKGEGLDTEYSVMPSKPSAVPADAHKAYRTQKIDLEKLFEGGDPFGGERDGQTPEINPEDVPFPPRH
jgi:hypothetical protein